MKKIVLFLLVAIVTLTGTAQQKVVKSIVSNETLNRPKLVVGIVVDQMRWDYLYRYYDRYKAGGFKRLLREGFSCENTLINYVPTVTGVGHTSIYTGSVPAISGIAENYWVEQFTGKEMYCTDDSTVWGVGADKSVGKMSPRNLLVSTVTDELRKASNFQSKVIGISLKDRASILPAGHSANGAFWFDDASGNFISSSYYMQELPDWVVQFNKSGLIKNLISKGWNTLYPIESYRNSESDNVPYEETFTSETTPTFPHKINEIYQTDKGSFRYTPFGNTLTLDFAKQAILATNLGKGKATDFLTINCASTDYVGHKFGPNSIEIEDVYLRLDLDLAAFFTFLDNRIGKGQYTIFLTADHGVGPNAGFLKKNQLSTGFVGIKAITDTLNKILESNFNQKDLIRQEIGDQVLFDLQKINSLQLDYTKIKKITTSYLERQPGILYAVDIDQIDKAPIPEPLKTMIINGYNIKRTSPIRVILNPDWSWGATYAQGAGHGSIHPYDTHIPLVFMGWGIRHGVSRATVHITDIAPTISDLLHIQMPNGNVGQVIEAALK
jgi:predicted AlkP superfamily pyrophosphatase or phosphodiesterase